MTDHVHSELGASSCERWWNCPASVRLSRGVPRTDTEASQRGTAEHEIAQMCLVNNQDAIEYVGRTIAGVEIDAEAAERVQVFLDDVRELIPAVALRDSLMVEVKFSLESLNPPAPMFGTADVAVYVPVWRKLFVRDYKSGWHFVSATDNKQLKYYALGASLALGADHPVSEIEVSIIQPRHTSQQVRRDTFDAIELAEWSLELMNHAADTMEPDAPANAGPWCKFCPVEGSCQTRAAARLADAQIEFAEVMVPREDWAGEVTVARLPDPRILTPAEVSHLLRRAPEIEDFITALRVHAVAAINRGEEIPGWKLTATDGRTAWRDQAEAETELLLLEVDPFAPRELISPAVARKALAATIRERLGAKVRGSAKQAEAEARATLAALTHKPKTGVALVPDTDPRPSLSTGGSEFLESSTKPTEH